MDLLYDNDEYDGALCGGGEEKVGLSSVTLLKSGVCGCGMAIKQFEFRNGFDVRG